MFLIPKSSLRPMRGYLLAIPLLNLLLLGGVFWVHAETKARLSGALVSSSIHLPKTKSSNMYSVDKIIISLKGSAPTRAQLEEGDRLLKEGKPDKAAELFRKAADGAAAVETYLGERRIPDNGTLVRQIREMKAKYLASNTEDPILVLCADGSVPYAKIVEVLDAARAESLQILLATENQAELPGLGAIPPPRERVEGTEKPATPAGANGTAP